MAHVKLADCPRLDSDISHSNSLCDNELGRVNDANGTAATRHADDLALVESVGHGLRHLTGSCDDREVSLERLRVVSGEDPELARGDRSQSLLVDLEVAGDHFFGHV